MNDFLQHRVLHFDMKAMIPTAEYMLKLLPEIAEMGYNTLLVEFEDKFPYQNLPEIVHADAWSRAEFAAFRECAASCGLSIVPLVQCAGHLDYVLKHEKYRHLREGDPPRDSTNEWCLHDPAEPFAVFQSMVQEILEFFPDSEYFHIGGDEYDCSHKCSRCQDSDRFDQFLDHVLNCTALVKSAGKKVIIWDDMFRKHDSEKLDSLLCQVIPCVWQYVGVNCEFVERMCKVSGEVWGASKIQNNPGYRGIGAQDAVMTNVDDWACVTEKYPVKGLVATIWGRNRGLSPLAQTVPESFYMIGYQGRTMTGGLISSRTAFRKEFADKFFGLEDMPWIDDLGYDPEKAAAGIKEAQSFAKRNHEILKVWELFNTLDCLWKYCDMCFGSNMASYCEYINMRASDDITFNFRDGVRITAERAEALRSRLTGELAGIFTPELLKEYAASRLDGMLAVNMFWKKIIDDAIAGKNI